MSGGGGERGMVELNHTGDAGLILHRGAVEPDELLAVVKLFLRHGR